MLPLGLGIGLLHLAPLLASADATPSDHTFLGYRHQASDVAQYLAIARESAETGSPATHNPFVTEVHDGRFVVLFLWVVGLVHRFVGLSLPVAYHAVGVVAVGALGVAVYGLATRLLGTARAGLATAVVLLAVGPPWLSLAFGAAERTEVLAYFWNWSTFGAAALPMWCAALTGVVLGLRALLAGHPGRAGLAVFLTYLTHPYTGVATGALLTAVAVFGPAPVPQLTWARRLRVPGVAALLLAPVVLWQLGDPVFLATAENAKGWVYRYTLWDALETQWPLWLLAGVGLSPLGRWVEAAGASERGAARLVGGWLLLMVGLSQLPGMASVKFQYLTHLPLALAAAAGVDASLRWAGRAGPALGAAALLAGPASLLLAETRATRVDPFVHVPTDTLAVLAVLEAAPPGGVVTDPSLGNLVPWRTGKPVFAGHWFMSTEWPKRLAVLESLGRPEVPLEVKRSLLAAANLRYALLTPSFTLDAGLIAERLAESKTATLVSLRTTAGR